LSSRPEWPGFFFRAFLSAPGHAAEGSLFDLRVLPPPKKLAASHYPLSFPFLPSPPLK
jgi:hypothetical protein